MDLPSSSSTDCSSDVLGNVGNGSPGLSCTSGNLRLNSPSPDLRTQEANGTSLSECDHSRQNSINCGAIPYFQPVEITKICCVGAGYVGGPTAAVIALHNPHIKFTVVDGDETKINQWNSRHLPVHEVGLKEILRVTRDGTESVTFISEPNVFERSRTLSSLLSVSESETSFNRYGNKITVPSRLPNLFFSVDVLREISEAEIILIAVNTPTKTHGIGAGKVTDMTAIEAVSKQIALHAKSGTIIVERSTVPCRTSETIEKIIKTYRQDSDLEILSNPEFMAEGTAISDLLHPSRVIIGSRPTPSGRRAAAALSSIYEAWVPRSKIITVNTWSAELSKLVANAMLAQRVSSINSISAICEATGADINEVAHSVGLDPRIGDQFLQAGVGFGGSCFKKDILSLIYLAEGLRLSEVAEYWQQVLTINDWQRKRFARIVITCLNGTLTGKKLTVLGYAFKKDTADKRDSPSVECIKMLLEDTPAEIAIYDPCCNQDTVKEEMKTLIGREVLKKNGGPINVCVEPYEACWDSHAIIIMTDADEFRTSLNKSPASKAEGSSIDPRPFQHSVPTESELLSLQTYLSSHLNTTDPFQRLKDEPPCEKDCSLCKLKTQRKLSRDERMDWSRIANHLQEPKWVFDGRGVLDIDEMAALGVRVKAIGKPNGVVYT
ncbi:NAD(P)-binding Rossmann-fold containing protein [Glarea lozoyensis ATCC 20868]|uniref:UDP-glucose 6-dehydrogenase n=1 Tax=Glarea lozoyensis (strain ATCC 20868 / MF5171) TaxID=1116229 RepID=S3CPB1_GLAL2|nr:NAD(P)-binding Rossmann-fold containing protein [Glarea lozoyensis ATCC 20868]EPE28282.1 NAD(P)-binding Rossmann-fold containing protein [Glarea lozoyensis ATCC 20868]